MTSSGREHGSTLTLLPASQVPRAAWRDEFHALPLGAPFGLAICLTLAVLPALVLRHILVDDIWVARWGWIPLAMLLSAGTAVPLLIARVLWEEVRAALRATNWSVRLLEGAVYVNLRSWRNWRLGASNAVAVRIPWSAIDAVYRVHEEWRVLPRAGVRRRFKSYVALRLRPQTDLEPLRRAVFAEVGRVLAHPAFVRGFAAWNDVPAFVNDDGAVYVYRVEMSLLRAVAHRIARGEMVARTCTVGPEFMHQPQHVEPGQLLALVLRGEWGLAQMTAQFRMGMGYDASVALIARLVAEAASRQSR